MSTSPALTTDAAGLPAMPSVADFASSPNMALAIWFNDDLFNRAKTIASYISKAEGFAPPHLIGKSESCFAVVVNSLNWRMNPYAVAGATYQTPGGKVGYEGKLVQAILEHSGRLDGGVTFEHFGDWSKVTGKFEKKRSDKGREFAVPAWNQKDEDGLGVIVRATIKGEAKPREFKFLLVQAFPRNSTLWALDPMTQICYLAVRRFASVCTPSLLMGVPFDREDEVSDMVEVNPAPARPQRSDFTNGAAPTVIDAEAEPEPDPFVFTSADGEVTETTNVDEFVSFLANALDAESDLNRIEGLWETNSGQLDHVRAADPKLADEAHEAYSLALDRIHVNGAAQAQHQPETPAAVLDRIITELEAATTEEAFQALAEKHSKAIGDAARADRDAYRAWLPRYETKLAALRAAEG